jgi:hypothetical protein
MYGWRWLTVIRIIDMECEYIIIGIIGEKDGYLSEQTATELLLPLVFGVMEPKTISTIWRRDFFD